MRLAAEEVSFAVDGARLLDGVSLTLEPGSLTVLVGPNGAGKSTLLRCLGGEIAPTAGTVRLDDRPLAAHALRTVARHRAVLPQASRVVFPFSAWDVVLMGRHPHLDRRGESLADREIAWASMAETETETFAQRSFPTLSGGEQARVNMARVLAQRTPVVLLDEPTAHLDPRHQHLTLRKARELADAGGSVLAVLHDLNLASAYADHVAVMASGRMRIVGSPWEALTEHVLQDVFHLRFHILPHPERDCPLLVPVPGTPPDRLLASRSAAAGGDAVG